MILDTQQADERAEAIRALLAAPLTTRDDDPDTFRLVAVHRDWLADRFDHYCGWQLSVDVTGGTARLVKRRADPDATRPAVRPSDGRPFDPYRYVLLMSCCAELVARPHTTISDLADTLAVTHAADGDLPAFDAGNHRHRNAFTDVLRWLQEHRLLTVTAGAVDQYSAQGRDAVLSADVSRLAQLPASTTAPSRIDADTTDRWLAALTAEPRYGDPAADTTPEQRNLWARHTLVRALLDDPAVDVAALDPRMADYLASITGRGKATDAAGDAGLQLERHADVLVAVDPTRQATDATFGDSAATVAQAAAAVLAELLGPGRTARTRPVAELAAHIADLLAADPGWARAYQDDTGPRRLTRAALDHLTDFALVEVTDGHATARPAATRLDLDVIDRRTAATPDPDPTTATAHTDDPT